MIVAGIVGYGDDLLYTFVSFQVPGPASKYQGKYDTSISLNPNISVTIFRH